MNSENKSIQVSIILEIAGRPPEHLTKTLNGIIGEINTEKGTKVINQKIHEPVLIPGQKDFYSSFTELEIEIENLEILSQLVLKYMPSHLEIISANSISIKPSEITGMFGNIIKKMHTYDETARIIQTKRVQLEKELKELKEKSLPSTSNIQ